MRTLYFENCTFFALFLDQSGAKYSRMMFVANPSPDPAYFFNWIQGERDKIKKELGGSDGVATLDCKVIPANGFQYVDYSLT